MSTADFERNNTAPEATRTGYRRGEGTDLDQGATHVHCHSEPSLKTSNPWVRLSASSFPYRFPRLYGLALELRSLCHRSLLIWLRGDIRLLEMGPVWRCSHPGGLVRDRRTLARRSGTQKLQSCFPWLSPEDLHLYLGGWDAAQEWCGHCTGDSSDTTKQNPSPFQAAP
jgi:hypothetical protein